MPIRLSRCPSCNAHVRDADVACPCCGAATSAPPRAHRGVIAAVAIVGIAAAGCAYGPADGEFYVDTADTAGNLAIDTAELPDSATGTVGDTAGEQ